MRKKVIQGIVIGVVATGASGGLWTTGSLERWELATWDARVQQLASSESASDRGSDRIKLILVDQPSLDWAKNDKGWGWPWPREFYSALTDFCRRGGARAVVFDVLFSEPSSFGVEDDSSFGRAIADMPRFVGSLTLGSEAASGEHTAWPASVPDPKIEVAGLQAWLDAHGSHALDRPKASFPVEAVATHATLLGDVTGDPDRDGIVRRYTLLRRFDGRVVPSLGLAAYLAGYDGPQDAAGSFVGAIRDGMLEIGDARVPIDDAGRAVLKYRAPGDGEHSAYERFSAAAVIESELRLLAGGDPPIKDPGRLRDSYVFVGFSAPGLKDLRPTPLNTKAPGVEIHATALDNLLQREHGEFVAVAPRSYVLLVTLGLAVLASLSTLITRMAWQSTVAVVAFLLVPPAIGWVAFTADVWWPVVFPESAILLSLGSAVLVSYATEGRQKAFIKRAFRFYLSPAVIDAILENPSQLKLGGERRELTILFTDLQGFSAISERLDAEELTALLNDYLTDMTDIILDEGGTLDKYEGDAILAFWNAPLEQPDHAVRACRAAVRCQRKLAERRPEFRERTGVEMYMRVGINTGVVVVGNMGSHKRFDYTVLGDAANLASRLEGANKQFETYAMVSDTTWAATDGVFTGRELGRIRVVGRKTPTRVYELVAEPGEPAPTIHQKFEQGLALCYEARWSEAVEVLDQCGDDPVARKYARKCRSLLEDPDATWDGVWNLTEK